jgi:hypothetical protein
MLAKMRIINPHYPGSPARMADGRLFTDYRPNCSLLGPISNASFDKKRSIQQSSQISTDRSLTAMRAGSTGCVDTMVPELTMRVCAWDGCATLPAQPVGIGQGRLHLPGRPDLAAGDPDAAAAALSFPLFGTFSPNPNLYVAAPLSFQTQRLVVPARPNRYSAPYG